MIPLRACAERRFLASAISQEDPLPAERSHLVVGLLEMWTRAHSRWNDWEERSPALRFSARASPPGTSFLSETSIHDPPQTCFALNSE
jgi:hypothetical protein